MLLILLKIITLDTVDTVDNVDTVGNVEKPPKTLFSFFPYFLYCTFPLVCDYRLLHHQSNKNASDRELSPVEQIFICVFDDRSAKARLPKRLLIRIPTKDTGLLLQAQS